MNWRTEWRALSDRIIGLSEATTVFLSALSVENSDPYGTKRKQLLPGARSIFSELKAFSQEHGLALPLTARKALVRFLADNESLLTNAELDNLGAVVASVVALSGFRAEFEYQLADLETTLLRLSQRAFVHLQRQIVADPEVRTKWREAFQSGEVACEKLGSVHLLQHGIWAFKVSGEGERTDLVFAEPLGDLQEIASVAEGLVLTEWKVVRSPSELSAKLAQAREQADRYSEGVLGGIELGSYRYLVIVSQDRIDLPPGEETGSVAYKARERRSESLHAVRRAARFLTSQGTSPSGGEMSDEGWALVGSLFPQLVRHPGWAALGRALSSSKN